MTAHIDNIDLLSLIGSNITIPSNVKRAFNFYYPPPPDSLCPLVGSSTITAENPTATVITSTPISDPVGPDDGVCIAHRNMDNDRRIWPPIMNYIVQSTSDIMHPFVVSGQITGLVNTTLPVQVSFKRLSKSGAVPLPLTVPLGRWWQGFEMGATYRATPSRKGCKFNPPSIDFDDLTTTVDFVAACK